MRHAGGGRQDPHACGLAGPRTSCLKAEESPTPAPPARLKLDLEDEGWLRGPTRPQPSPSPSSLSWGTTTSCNEEVEEVKPNPRKPTKKKKTQQSARGTP